MSGPGVSDLRELLADQLAASRVRSLALLEPLPDADLLRQVDPLMSPLVWDLAHVGNYEELWLLRALTGSEPVLPGIDRLYDAFEHPRASRTSLPILPPAQARAYLQDVRSRVLDVLDRADLSADLTGADLTGDGFVWRMVVQHEHQHDETMLATLQLKGGPRTVPADGALPPGRPARAHDDVLVPGGWHTVGTNTDPAALDNERPAHQVSTPTFRIDRFPVSNAQFGAFVAAGGYDQPQWWDPVGWAHLQTSGRKRPGGWQEDGTVLRFGEVREIDPAEPVQHVCFWEADAYSRWAGRRLPTEHEWEKACGWDGERLRRFPWGDDDPTPELANLGAHAHRPAAVGAYPAGASAWGVEQLVGDVWEWTSSGFDPWPGFRARPYPEYSQVFFGGDFRCLRGGSWATHPTAVRSTFRNWDLPIRRQIFAGFRTAVDVESA